MRTILSLGLVVTSVIWAGCSSGRSTTAVRGASPLNVVASFFPLAEAARRVGGSSVVVSDLTPVGVEPHDLEVGPHQLAAIRAADVVVDMGKGFQPAVERAAAGRPNTVDVLPAIGGEDPHVWLDPVGMQQIVRTVADAFDRADPARRKDYDRGAREFGAALGALDISYRTSLSDCPRHDVVTAHAAFGRMAARYGLTEHAITGLVPGGDPDPRRIDQLAGLIRSKGVTTVFSEPLVPAHAAETLAGEVHVKIAVLDPIEGLTAAEAARGTTYLSLMAADRDTLRQALGCLSSEG